MATHETKQRLGGSEYQCQWKTEKTWETLPLPPPKKPLIIKNCVKFVCCQAKCRSQWSLSLRRRSAAACLLVLRVRILSGTRKFVYCACCVLSGKGLCIGLITRPKQSYRLWGVCLNVLSERPHSGGPLGAVARWNEQQCL